MEDQLIDEIREIRIKISNKFNNDPESLINYYIEKQKEHEGRFLNQDVDIKETTNNRYVY